VRVRERVREKERKKERIEINFYFRLPPWGS